MIYEEKQGEDPWQKSDPWQKPQSGWRRWSCENVLCCHVFLIWFIRFWLTAFLRFSRYERDEGKVENVENVEPKNANAARWANDTRHSTSWTSSEKEAPQPQSAARGVPPVPLGANGRSHETGHTHDPSNLRGKIFRSKMLREPEILDASWTNCIYYLFMIFYDHCSWRICCLDLLSHSGETMLCFQVLSLSTSPRPEVRQHMWQRNVIVLSVQFCA